MEPPAAHDIELLGDLVLAQIIVEAFRQLSYEILVHHSSQRATDAFFVVFIVIVLDDQDYLFCISFSLFYLHVNVSYSKANSRFFSLEPKRR